MMVLIHHSLQMKFLMNYMYNVYFHMPYYQNGQPMVLQVMICTVHRMASYSYLCAKLYLPVLLFSHHKCTNQAKKQPHCQSFHQLSCWCNQPGLYRGELNIVLYNFSDTPFQVHYRDHIAQLLFPYIAMPLVTECQLTKTDQGDKGFGSTGHNELTTDNDVLTDPSCAVICNATPDNISNPNNSSDSSGCTDLLQMPYNVYLSSHPFDHISYNTQLTYGDIMKH